MDKKKVYVPQPLNLEEVVLPEEVLELSKKIAKNIDGINIDSIYKFLYPYIYLKLSYIFDILLPTEYRELYQMH